MAVVVLLLLLYYFTKSSGISMSDMQEGSTMLEVPASKIPGDASSNYTYSMWFFVDDWGYKYGQKKILLQRTDEATGESIPEVYLGETENNVNIKIGCMGNQNHTCKVENVPLQKWVNLIISLNGRSLDVYVDGKLIRTCVLPATTLTSSNAPLTITPNGGFKGWTSSFVYWAAPTSPKEAYNIYKKGYGGSMMGNLFNKYRMRLTFVKDGRELNSFEV